MKPTMTPDLPWIKVASDIFDWRGDHYLLLVDYPSRYIEVDKLKDMSSTETIEFIKSQICCHGIPEELQIDNGPQYSSKEFEKLPRVLTTQLIRNRSRVHECMHVC